MLFRVSLSKKSRSTLLLVLAVLVPVALVAAGWAIISGRAGSGGGSQSLSSPQPSASPSGSASPAPVARWTVGKATAELVVRAAPTMSAAVKWRLPKVNINGYPQLVLVNTVKEVSGTTWYRVSVAVRPNGSNGWVPEGSLAFYQTTSRIDINLTTRRLTVYVRGAARGSFAIGIGEPRYPTPLGAYFINQKLTPSSPGGPYGVLALGISAFQPKLANWPQGGPVAIHGTNQPALVGQPVSHGCIRMRNADILKVNAWVPSGSPVIIHK
jgi:lipoprotein-anchoring transpeptidase ErfK/SrfK